MNRLLILIKGELQRLTKYNVTMVSMLVAITWFLLLYFIDDINFFQSMLPFIIMIDASMMAVLYIGAIMFFEKTESTISTMLVTPTTDDELILSKVIANVIHMLFSSMLIIVVFFFVKDISVNWPIIILSIIISVAFHSLLGFVFSFHTKDFTSMLLGVMLYSFILVIPSGLYYLNVIKGDIWGYILLITPSQAAIEMIAVGLGEALNWRFFVGLGVLLIYGTFGYFYYIKPKFKAYAVKQSGV